ncbi:MAG: hypothetical protein GH155_00440 [Spirochaeta sp.]|nr:hypothetical protein [Spirochaeta sp.]
MIFFFVVSLLLLGIYLLGNFQDFLDTSQLFLLKILEFFLLIEVVLSLFYIIFILFYAVNTGKLALLRLLLAFFSLSFCFVLLLVLKFLSIAANSLLKRDNLNHPCPVTSSTRFP